MPVKIQVNATGETDANKNLKPLDVMVVKSRCKKNLDPTEKIDVSKFLKKFNIMAIKS